MKQILTFALACTCGFAGSLAAQQPRSAGDSVLEHARHLVSSGREEDGRKLVDSLVQASTPQDSIYAEALYVRAAVAPTAAEAERDYRRLLIETPLAPRSGDAMLQLANLLQARGDRRGASEHLQRFLLTHASNPARPRAAVSLVRLLFEQGQSQEARGCEALQQARQIVPPENFELRNQLEFYTPRCTTYAQPTVTAAAPPPTPTAAPAVAPTAAPAGARAFYSVQVAAYDSDEAAQRVARLLVERGLDARVDGSVRPFRVRIGRYATRAEAVQALETLRSQGHPGFIAVVGAPR